MIDEKKKKMQKNVRFEQDSEDSFFFFLLV